ncbi:hypothetical protein [Antarcticimicrobium sediminis]|uniref:Uncharacterized protein n=1 Tax=Antarcticimicrobium sediminis TaxID=2546227 RepID=A0A4V2Z6J7_9RHOB|nr:hypothetical protein [Antarcticimicrobium sediminis]TDE32856.1 hypothetical protein E1B25_21870 [Antarcticimicrobium sediminis]
MKSKTPLFACLKALSYLVIACALVFLPPSTAHAASGMHNNQLVASISADHTVAEHAHGATSLGSKHDKSGSASKADHEDQGTGQCCSGICVSGMLTEPGAAFVAHATRGKYLMLNGRTASIKPSGFLRPPQHLI